MHNFPNTQSTAEKIEATVMKRLEKKNLASWSSVGSHTSIKGRGDAQGSIHEEDNSFTWSVMDTHGKIVYQGESDSLSKAKAAVEQKMRQNALT